MLRICRSITASLFFIRQNITILTYSTHWRISSLFFFAALRYCAESALENAFPSQTVDNRNTGVLAWSKVIRGNLSRRQRSILCNTPPLARGTINITLQKLPVSISIIWDKEKRSANNSPPFSLPHRLKTNRYLASQKLFAALAAFLAAYFHIILVTISSIEF